jgi:L-cysteine S-thiosulfotransferase
MIRARNGDESDNSPGVPKISQAEFIEVPSPRTGITVIASLSALTAACAYSPMFGFPVDQGDVDAGRAAFVDHQCHACHSVAGVDLPPLAGAPETMLELGGEMSLAMSYDALVTAIINPDHSISERYREQEVRTVEIPLASPMPLPAIDNMTVRQLIDIVAFLDSRYAEVEDYFAYD